MEELKKSFEEYFYKYYSQVLKYTIKKVSNVSIAEDIAMDTFVACYQKFDSFGPQKAKFATWLYVVLNNKIKNYYRDQKSLESFDDQINVVSEQEDEMFQAVYLSEMRSALACAIKTLNEMQQQIVIKKYFKNMTSKEIAEDMGTTPGNVRTQLARAINKLKQYFEEHDYNWEI